MISPSPKLVYALVAVLLGTTIAASAQRKDATAATKATNAKVLNELPFANKQDFEDAHRGFVAPLATAMVRGKAENLICNPDQYGFIKENEAAPDTVNPSL